MFLAVTAGLSGRVENLFAACAGWEQSSGHRLAALLQLGDLPLRHDFSDRRGGESRNLPGNRLTADLLHQRQLPPWPLIFLAGEKDEPALLASPPAHLQVASPDRPLTVTTPGPGMLYFLRSGGVVRLQGSGEELTIGGLSGFGGPLPSRRPPRSESRTLLRLECGSVPLLLAHDSPEAFLDSQAAGSPETTSRDHPGRAVVKAMQQLQPRLLVHGHGAGAARVWQAGATTVVSLPPWRRDGPPGPIAAVDTRSWNVQVL